MEVWPMYHASQGPPQLCSTSTPSMMMMPKTAVCCFASSRIRLRRHTCPRPHADSCSTTAVTSEAITIAQLRDGRNRCSHLLHSPSYLNLESPQQKRTVASIRSRVLIAKCHRPYHISTNTSPRSVLHPPPSSLSWELLSLSCLPVGFFFCFFSPLPLMFYFPRSWCRLRHGQSWCWHYDYGCS